MIYRWDYPNPFLKKVVEPSGVLPDPKVLEGCRAGLNKRIKQSRSKEEKARLRSIKEEIQFLIDNL